MELTTLKIAGADAVRKLNELRSQYSATGQYPFLIGETEEFERIRESLESVEQSTSDIINESLKIDIPAWIATRREEIEESGFSVEESAGEWPGEIREKGSICLHKDIVSGRIQAQVYLGIAAIEKPWHLPAVLRYGSWNDCPGPEIHCVFHRQWYERFGAEITGMSGNVVECTVLRPPKDQESATALAWEQFWYCSDIVDQGCGTVANLAATIMNSRYWFFWWD